MLWWILGIILTVLVIEIIISNLEHKEGYNVYRRVDLPDWYWYPIRYQYGHYQYPQFWRDKITSRYENQQTINRIHKKIN